MSSNSSPRDTTTPVDPERRRAAIVGAAVGFLAVVGLIVGLVTIPRLADSPASGAGPDTQVGAQPSTPGPEPTTTSSSGRAKPEVAKGTGPLTKLVVTTLVPGTGAPVKAGQTITVDYVGVFYTTGEPLDSSWGREPFTTVIGQGAVIKGWDQGLVGVAVGSRVQLDIPADLAYGENPTGGQPAGPLRFVIDVLSAA